MALSNEFIEIAGRESRWLLYKAKDGTDHTTYDAVRAINDQLKRGVSVPVYVPYLVQFAKDRLETLRILKELDQIKEQKSPIVIIDLTPLASTSGEPVRVDKQALEERWTNTQWLRFRVTGETPVK